ncbi:hypothetical protein [Pseudomonas sp. NIBRBAC000502773]|uniref:hypothetical protein n=1 Tax=Pseudomonas sp. NIBRBAC000502773 TaxID=2590776 RepID=UPI0011306B36|nr:hypothetical protein [Pseudomonas sp. NIBRBAC000502773]QDG59021.1 hypothetical protein NIBR502773_21665 [Pseudomonas sp. NIBRBAC000502773]
MKIRPHIAIATTFIAAWMQTVMAEAESNPDNLPSGQVFVAPAQAPAGSPTPTPERSTTSVEVVNASERPVTLIQTKLKPQTLPSKQKSSDLNSDKDPTKKLSLDLAEGAITVTPTEKDGAIRFVTLTKSIGPCTGVEYCLIVQ